ncbi:hypothetical protein DFH06DRAFT_741360 [Mycena polygramma]|nr:hypothetical protein DFH06DRAFT_741360 [Mycena polygramma]
MHRCLLVAEIFSHIAYFSTANTRGGIGGKKEVYRLALTCKAFSEPALDAVWQEIYNMMDLIYLLPLDLWHGPTDPQSTCCMTRDTVPSDWTRFLLHASRVRELSISRPPNERFCRSAPWNIDIFDNSSVLRHLHQQCPEPYMMPTISSLFWRELGVEDIHIFISPTLRNLHLVASTTYPGIVELLAARAPIMTSLEISYGRTSSSDSDKDANVDAIFSAIIRMDRLVAFRSDLSLPSRVLNHLSSLSTLERLILPLEFVDGPAFFMNKGSSPLFPSLSNLIACPSHPSLFGQFLSAISSPHLDSLWWEISDTDPNSILNVGTILADHCARDALTSVTITAPIELIFGGLPIGHAVTLPALNPLLTLGNLSELHLSIPWLDLGNEDVEQIARHLPQLTNLYLAPPSPSIVLFGRITPQGLLPLFHHCYLEFLGVVVNAGDGVPDSEFALPSRKPRAFIRRARRLHFLDLGVSRIGPTKVESMATFLAEAVPRLTTLTAWSRHILDLVADPVPPPSSSKMLWKQVADMYGELTLHEQSETNWFSWKGFNV